MNITCPLDFDHHDYELIKFPAGEIHLTLPEKLILLGGSVVCVTFNFKRSEDIFELLLLARTLHENNIDIGVLTIPYMPFGQADRVNYQGECFSLRLFCDLINDIVKPETVVVHDPHSDVTPALLRNCRVTPQWEILTPIIGWLDCSNPYLVCPDAGARKKTQKLAQITVMPIIQCDKTRNVITGEITGTIVNSNENLFGCDMIIVDDICVGGRTFVEIAKVLRSRNCGKIFLVTTNGVYSQGLGPFEGLIDEIWNHRGRVK